MDCHEAKGLLDDYVDRLLEVDRARAFEAHLDECLACREAVAGLRRLLEAAAALPASQLPGRDLWPGIRTQLTGTVVNLARQRRRRWAALGAVAAAAAVIVMVGSVVPLMRSNGPASVEGSLELAEQEYRAAKAGLLDALNRREGVLSAETVSTIEENLAVIESAVIEIRTAMADYPDNPHLERMLLATYRNEVHLLREAVRLANES